ncbi:hypothetical protein MalM25_01920 [Planctomycetes bacterium MalM25]|nr:hypothetical protein MalM25_01920 [Planctomycetes bacterium MalM25]
MIARGIALGLWRLINTLRALKGRHQSRVLSGLTSYGAKPTQGEALGFRLAGPLGLVHFASCFSIAIVNSGPSGSTRELKRPTTSPSLLTRNFSKFHFTLPG